MRNTIEETQRRRSIQIAYNEERGITPRTVTKTKEQIMATRSILDIRDVGEPVKYYVEQEELSLAAEPIVAYATRSQLEKMAAEAENKMKKASKDLDFITAAQHRDEMLALKKTLRERYGGEA